MYTNVINKPNKNTNGIIMDTQQKREKFIHSTGSNEQLCKCVCMLVHSHFVQILSFHLMS